MASEWYLPVGLSVVLMVLTAVCLYTFARLEMSRVNAYSLAVVGVAAEIVLMSLWVFAGPV
jgi:hypothetical protein